jgi:hypothetical protein
MIRRQYQRAATGTLTRHGACIFQLGDTAEAVGNVAKDAPASLDFHGAEFR